MKPIRKLPSWLKRPLPAGGEFQHTDEILKSLNLETICSSANCPNRGQCWTRGTATVLILGNICTRNCKFCAVSKYSPELLNPAEPKNVAMGVKELKLDYVVITSVTRDDLPDGGAEHFAKTVRAIKEINPNTKVEVLIPDLLGSRRDLKKIIDSKPDVIGHNVETVPSLYKEIRPMAEYSRSLDVIKAVKEEDNNIISKTGLMVGVGETKGEVIKLFEDVVKVGCDIITIGQYLAPSKEHYPVKEYITPDQFDEYKKLAEDMGILYAASSPFTRSSHLANEGYYAAKEKKRQI